MVNNTESGEDLIIDIPPILTCQNHIKSRLVVWNILYFSIQLGTIIPIDGLVFFRGVQTNNQLTCQIHINDNKYNKVTISDVTIKHDVTIVMLLSFTTSGNSPTVPSHGTGPCGSTPGAGRAARLAGHPGGGRGRNRNGERMTSLGSTSPGIPSHP